MTIQSRSNVSSLLHIKIQVVYLTHSPPLLPSSPVLRNSRGTEAAHKDRNQETTVDEFRFDDA